MGVLLSGSLSDPVTRGTWDALVDGLREHGWEEGRNVVWKAASQGGSGALPRIGKGTRCAQGRGDFGQQYQSIEAVRRATATIPIVMAGVMNPVGMGSVASVASLARPGGNVTGVVNQLETVTAKSFELLKALNPGIERVGISMSHIISICGSLRKGSYNRMVMNLLPGLAPAGMAIREAPSFSTFPLYNADTQHSSGFPAPVNALADAIRAADGVIFCTLEYNSNRPLLVRSAAVACNTTCAA